MSRAPESKPLQIAVVSCYFNPDYPRGVVLRQALAAQSDVEVTVIKNTHKGMLRYPEIAYKVLKARFTLRPDAYVLTFRGYELLLYFVLTLVRKPIIFDELINFEEWLYESRKLKPGTFAGRLFKAWYAWLLRHCRLILADTDEHARHSSQLSAIPLERYRTIPVGTVESTFSHEPYAKKRGQRFTVVYTSFMRRLHGLQYVLDAAVALKDRPEISFIIAGGKQKGADQCAEAVSRGAHVEYRTWIPFEENAKISREAGIILGGPFGNTTQAQMVITGKTFNCLAAGLPVLVGKNKVKSGLKDKVNCLLIPQGDAKAIKQAVEWAYGHPKELETIGKAGRKLYEERYSNAVITRLVGRVVDELRS